MDPIEQQLATASNQSMEENPDKIITPVRLFSPLAPVPMAKKLVKEMNKARKHKGYHVFGRGTQWVMNLKHAKRNGIGSSRFVPRLKAEMEPHDGGTLITGEVSQWTIPYPYSFRFGLGYFCAAILLIIWSATSPDTSLFWRIIVPAVPTLMLMVELFGHHVMDPPEKPEELGDAKTIIDWLEKTVEAQPAKD